MRQKKHSNAPTFKSEDKQCAFTTAMQATTFVVTNNTLSLKVNTYSKYIQFQYIYT